MESMIKLSNGAQNANEDAKQTSFWCHLCKQSFDFSKTLEYEDVYCYSCFAPCEEITEQTKPQQYQVYELKKPAPAMTPESQSTPSNTRNNQEGQHRNNGDEGVVIRIVAFNPLEEIMRMTRLRSMMVHSMMRGSISQLNSLRELINLLGDNDEPTGLSEEQLRALPRQELKENREEKCSVCYDQMKQGQVATQLKCNHEFHQNCVTTWLKDHNTCPVCRNTA